MGFDRVVLGRAGFTVSRLGLASSYGTDEAMVLEAVDRGVNYLYWGALRTKKMAAGIRTAARKNREDLVIVVHTMARTPSSLTRVVHKSLNVLGLDYVDVLLLGMVTRLSTSLLHLFDQTGQLRDKGLLRSVAVSSHARDIFLNLEKEKRADIFHVRYNAAHRGAENGVFAFLPEQGGPGIVSFTATRWGSLLKSASMPPGERPPSAPDCYRFVLSNPKVHVAVCGPSTLSQLKENLTVLESGPMSADELARMRHIGDYVHRRDSPLHAQLRAILDNIRTRFRSSHP